MFEGHAAPGPAGQQGSAEPEPGTAVTPDGTLVEEAPQHAGRYLLRDKLGEGSMGEVWRAHDPEIGRQVAVKLLRMPAGLSASRRIEFEQRFLREARAAGRLSHPGIVSVHDVGTTDDGRPFIVMEVVEGRDLEAIIREGPAPSHATVLGWGAQVASALDAAHRRDIVHRDIKPANILIDGEGRARITDFGIARLSQSDLTSEGLFLGSPAYASPEQLRGETVDGRTDLFSLGSSLYAILTGVRPFRGDNLSSLAYAICHVEPAPPSRLVAAAPAGCDLVFAKALAKDPARRYQTGADLARDLHAIAQAGPHQEYDAGPRVGRTVHAPVAGSVLPVAAADGAEFERKAAALGSRAAALLARTGMAVMTTTRVWARKCKSAWIRGWAMGPRVRAGMVVGSVVLAITLACGGYAIASRIVEARRDTPARKLKRAFKSLVGEMRVAPEGSNPSGQPVRKDDRHA